MSQELIVVENLSKLYKNSDEFSLQDVSLHINKGDKFGVFGPNGAGKTTLINIICNTITSTSGRVTFKGNVQPSIGFVPQDFALYLELTAQQNLEYFGALYKLSPKMVKERSFKLLEILGLGKVANKKVKNFSGGMKRRLNLAIGIIHEPDILLLDEPTVGVDIQSKNAIVTFLNSLNEQGTTIIYTSHHLAEAEEFCNNIAILDYGKLIAFDELSSLKERYKADSLMDIILELTGKEYRD